MKLIGVLLRYIRFWFKAKKHYALHSPFVFDLYTNVLSDKHKYADYSIVEKRRKALLKNKRLISFFDMGTGANCKSEYYKKIKTITKRSSCTPLKGQLLFRLARYFNPKNILELGTSVGISTMYLSLGAPESQIYTIEGCSNLASIAESSFKKANINNVSQNIGNFKNILPDLLMKLGKIDFLFLDGDHRKENTIEYFDQCINYIGSNSIFILDDIHWSKSMENAWQQIIKHPGVKISIDLFYFGILLFKDDFDKQSFTLRF